MPTVLILGAASDIGVAVAESFAANGYDVQLAARRPDRLEALQPDLAIRFSVRVSLNHFDALDPAMHRSFLDQLQPAPDVVVCVFGYLGDQQKAVADWEEAARIIHTNFTGAVSVLNLVAERMVRAGKGTIVGISSVAGDRGRQSNYLYGSAKAGLSAYLSGLRNRLYAHGVHVLTVKPGFVYTKMTEGLALPPLLTATPAQVGRAVYRAVRSKKNVVYIKWFWRWIMLIIRLIPEPIFKRMKL